MVPNINSACLANSSDAEDSIVLLFCERLVQSGYFIKFALSKDGKKTCAILGNAIMLDVATTKP
jgi:hypothetical protein